MHYTWAKNNNYAKDLYWISHVDGESNSHGNSLRLILANPDRIISKYVLRFDFNASNNTVEYEVLIARLKIAKELQVQELKFFFDFQLVVR